MVSVIGLAGSLRRGSYNLRLLKAAEELAPEGARLEVATMHGIPVYDGDLETEQGVPEVVQVLKERIVESDGLLIATPEYNNSIPGPLKNAVDWLTRPPKDIGRVFGGKPVGLIGATPGRGGTRLSQAAWLPVLRTLGTAPYFGHSLYVAGAADVFDGDRLVDETIRRLLTGYLEGFLRFAENRRRQ